MHMKRIIRTCARVVGEKIGEAWGSGKAIQNREVK